MSIAVFSNFVNGIPTTIYDGKDVSMVMLVDPPANLPAFFLAGKGILDTTTQTIKVYDETGNTVIHNFDISGTDLTPINEAISALEGRVGTNETNISTLQVDVSTNSTDIVNNASDIDSLQGRTSTLESTSGKHTTDIIALQSATGGNASDISALTLRVGQNETDIAAVLITANAADTLSKQNKDRLDNLLPPPSLEGYIKTGDDATLNSVSFGDNTKIDTQPDLGLVLQGDYLYGKADSGLEHFFVESGNFNVKSKKIQKVNDGQAVDDAVNVRQLNAVESKADNAQSTADGADALSKTNQNGISALSTTVGDNTKDIEDLSTKVDEVEVTANAADAMSNTNAVLLEDALLKDGYGWDTNNLNVYNVSRLSRTNNAVNSSGVSIGDTDVNLHGDTVGITSSNSATTYAVFTSGGLNLNDFPLTRMGSGGDNDTNAATIGDVKRIATDGSGLKPVDETWDMLGYPVLNIGMAETNILKVTKGDDKTKFSDILIDGNANTEMNFVGDTHFYVRDKSNNAKGLEAFQIDSSARFVAKQKVKTPIITNLGSGTTNSNSDKAAFIDLSVENEITLGAKSKVSFHVAGNGIIEAAASGLKLLRDADANNHSISKMGDLKFSSGYQIEGGAIGDLKIRNVEGVYKNDSTDNNSLRFDGDDAKYKAAHHMYYANGGTSQIFGISTAGANLFNHNIIKVKHITANSAGSMNVAGVKLLKRDDAQDAQQSIQLNAGDITSYSDKHEWKTNENARRLTIENHKADWHDCQLNNIADAVDDKDVPNLAQVKSLVTEEWFEVAHGNLASDGNRPTGGSSDSNLNVWHTSVAESTTNPNNEFKISFNGAYGKIKDWTYPLRYKLVQGDKVQYWKVGANGWETGTNVWHLSAESVEGDDLVTGTDTVVYASAYMVDSGGDSPQEMDGFKKYITTSNAVTYYEHQGDSHLYIDWTGNGGVISLDTMRNGTDQQEDIFMLHNKTDTEMSVRFFFNGSSVTQVVAARSFIQGWANRDLGKWVVGTYKDPSFVPEQLVIKATDLSWSTSSDPRVNTQRMIAAAPEMCTIIGIHKLNGSAKEKIVSVGDSNRVETQTSSFVVNKNSPTHATGICTSEESSGKTWSRILDGSRGAWFTNESANSRMASVDIDPSEYPEEQIFFTTDQGIMETYVDEVDGEIKLRPLEGYNVPKNEADIAALEVQTEKNRSVTHYFINEGTLSYDWPDETRRPLVEVGVLNTTQTINNSSVTVTDNDTHKYSGNYNTVGSIAINPSGDWTNQYTYHNCYKHVSESYYVVFNQGNASWQVIESENPHTAIGDHASSVTVQLGGQTSLPESFGDYTIDPNFTNIDSLEFLTAEVPIQYDDISSRVIINFNGAKPSGYVVLK